MLSQALTKAMLRMFLLIAVTTPLPTVNAPVVQADTEVGGPIMSDTTWTPSNSPYTVVESIDVWEGVTLTIEPGVTVKFDSGKSLEVNGGLVARGTSDSLITFTSSSTTPQTGDWGFIDFTETAITTTMDSEGNYLGGSVLQYCTVEYGFSPGFAVIDAHSLLIDHCVVEHNFGGVVNSGTSTAPSRVTHNTVRYNHNNGIDVQYGLVGSNLVSSNLWTGIRAEYSTVRNNTVTNNLGQKHGGGVYAQQCTVQDNIVRDNWLDRTEQKGGGIYAIDSTVSGNTVVGNRLTDGWGYGAGIYVIDSVVLTNSVRNNAALAPWTGGGGIYAQTSHVVSNTVKDNSAYALAAGVLADESTVRANLITHNVIDTLSERGDLEAKGAGIYAEDSDIADNVVVGNDITVRSARDDSIHSLGGGIYAAGGTIVGNTITLNTVSARAENGDDEARGAGAHIVGVGGFFDNSVVGNSGQVNNSPAAGGLGIDADESHPDLSPVHGNNLYGNSPYDVVVHTRDDISGTHNYWGTVAQVDILAQVYDWYDNNFRGKFLYVPYLQEPSEDAPFPPPTGLSIDVQDGAVRLFWDAHPSFTTGYGYKVYYDTDSSLPPYEGTGLNEGDSPIDVGDQTAYTLTGLDPSKDYYFAVTAYDNEGHESWYSNMEWMEGGYWVYLPVVLRE